MTKNLLEQFRFAYRFLISSLTVIAVLVITSVSSFAAEGGGTEQTGVDVTKTVEDTPVKFEWFYWLGWAFVAAVIFLGAAVFFGWYKSVLGPKYRGKKVTQ